MESKYVRQDYLNSSKNFSGKEKTGSEEQYERVQHIGSVIVSSGGKKLYALTIIGQIEGHTSLSEDTKTTKYEHIIPELVAIEQDSEVEGLLILLNTVGGDIEAGLAIAELISSMSKPSVSLVIGGGHSIGVPLAVCTDYSFIVPSATMMVHPVRTNGTTLGVEQSFENLRRMQQRIVDFVVEHSKISEKRFYELCMNTEEMSMDVGTVIDGNQAVKEGLINEVGGLSNAMDTLKKLSKRRKTKKNRSEKGISKQ